MIAWRRVLPGLAVFIGLIGFAWTDSSAAALRAGAATSNITPPLGSEILGSFDPQPSQHIHDELHARCLVLDDGEKRIALVVCDLIGLHAIVSREARRLIAEATGIPPENILITATHTHSGPNALGPNLNWYPRDPVLNDYQRFVARRIADGVQRAVNLLRPAELAFSAIDVPEHVHNRRWLMRLGSVAENPFGTSERVKMNPPVGSPNLVEPAGPVDPQLCFIAVREPDGKPISVYAAYSLHYVGHTGRLAVSADYFGMFCEALADELNASRFDPPFVAMLANGTSGDVNNVDFRNPPPSNPPARKGPYEQMRYVAEDLAEKVHRAMAALAYRNDVTVEARYRELEIGLRNPTPEQLRWARAASATPEMREATSIRTHRYAKWFQEIANDPPTTNAPVQVLRIGDICIGSMPCEVFAETGLEFKQRAPLKKSFLVELGHAYLGYLPTPRHFELGGYETWLGTNRLEPQASVKMLDALIEMAEITKE